MNETEGIIMFHIGRSGSTVLSNLLSQNREIEWDDEPFEHLAAHNQRSVRNVVRWMPLRLLPMQFLQRRRKRSKASCYGFDLKFYHLSDREMPLPKVLENLASRGFQRIISLRRKNYLRKIISSVSALQQGVYHLDAGERPKNSSVIIDPNSILIDGDNSGLVERFKRWDQCFNELEAEMGAFKSLSLSYEDDIFENPKVGYQRICDFLGLEAGEVAVKHSRTTATPLEEKVSNWSEVCDALAGTDWEWMLNDGAD